MVKIAAVRLQYGLPSPVEVILNLNDNWLILPKQHYSKTMMVKKGHYIYFDMILLGTK